MTKILHRLLDMTFSFDPTDHLGLIWSNQQQRDSVYAIYNDLYSQRKDGICHIGPTRIGTLLPQPRLPQVCDGFRRAPADAGVQVSPGACYPGVKSLKRY